LGLTNDNCLAFIPLCKQTTNHQLPSAWALRACAWLAVTFARKVMDQPPSKQHVQDGSGLETAPSGHHDVQDGDRGMEPSPSKLQVLNGNGDRGMETASKQHVLEEERGRDPPSKQEEKEKTMEPSPSKLQVQERERGIEPSPSMLRGMDSSPSMRQEREKILESSPSKLRGMESSPSRMMDASPSKQRLVCLHFFYLFYPLKEEKKFIVQITLFILVYNNYIYKAF